VAELFIIYVFFIVMIIVVSHAVGTVIN